jgi:hypothetical protein
LFVRGNGARAMNAIRAVREACDACSGEPPSLRVIDVYNQPGLVEKYRVIATPTLVTSSGVREWRLVGEMSAGQLENHLRGEGHEH